MNKPIKKAKKALDAGRYADAREALGKYVRNNPLDVDGHYLLGVAHAQLGNTVKALESLRIARDLSPGSPWILTNLGGVHQLRGDVDKALEFYRQALTLRPDLLEALNNRAVLLEERRDFPGAIAHYERSLAIDPTQPIARRGLGHCLLCIDEYDKAKTYIEGAIRAGGETPALLAMLGHIFRQQGDLGAAADVYRKSLAADPDNEVVGFLLAAVSGAHILHPPARYVRDVFDEYAVTFERETSGLCYDLPDRIDLLLKASITTGVTFPAALDLGCGTGLVGAAIAHGVADLVGVDIAPNMLQQAEFKGVYRRLVESDILDYLTGTEDMFDLIVAADVFIYVGDLDEVIPAIARRLNPGGTLVFSTESQETPGFVVRATGRFAHSRAYIDACLEAAQLQMLEVQAIDLRKEHGQWIPGDLYVAQPRSRPAGLDLPALSEFGSPAGRPPSPPDPAAIGLSRKRAPSSG